MNVKVDDVISQLKRFNPKIKVKKTPLIKCHSGYSSGTYKLLEVVKDTINDGDYLTCVLGFAQTYRNLMNGFGTFNHLPDYIKINKKLP